MDNLTFKKGDRFEIFIGIKDKDSYEEILTVDDFKNILSDICFEKEINFSLITQLGGYKHGKGYTTETSLRIVIVGINEQEVNLLSQKLKEKINTDAVLIVKSEIEYCFV